jgi:hypothetical protein
VRPNSLVLPRLGFGLALGIAHSAKYHRTIRTLLSSPGSGGLRVWQQSTASLHTVSCTVLPIQGEVVRTFGNRQILFSNFFVIQSEVRGDVSTDMCVRVSGGRF